MMSPRDKILTLVSDGAISPQEGEKLLLALTPERSKLDTWLLDPFEVLKPSWSWLLAITVCIGSLILSRFHVRYDGTLDLHLAKDNTLFTTALIDQALAWPLTALLFWIVAALFGQRPRLVELVGFVGAARFPYLLSGIFAALLVGDPASFDPNGVAAMALIAATIPFSGWLFLSLLSAFRAASGTAGRSLAAKFFVAVVVSEVLSKSLLKVVL